LAEQKHVPYDTKIDREKALHASISSVILLITFCVWSSAFSQPTLNEAAIVQSLKPQAKTRSLSIERTQTNTQSTFSGDTAPVSEANTGPGPAQPQVSQTLAAESSKSVQLPRPELTLVIQFTINSADIQAQSFDQLNTLARAMQTPELRPFDFLVEGHTDSSGTPAANLKLSEKRAQSISRYLQARGIAPDRIHPIGLGSSRPLGGLPANAPANRRVIIATRI